MARSNKFHDERKYELAKEIWSIFLENGYEKTTLSVIMKKLNINKGSFYHYFKSKEECGDYVIDLYVKNCIEKIKEHDDTNNNCEQRFVNLILYGMNIFNEEKDKNSFDKISSDIGFHQKLMAQITKQLSLVYEKIIKDGVEENIFDTKYPLETAEMIITLSNFYFDNVIFNWNREEYKTRVIAFTEAASKMLGSKNNFLKILLMKEV